MPISRSLNGRKNEYIFRALLLVLINLIGIIVCVYFLLGFNLINQINVEGNKEVPAQEIINASNLKVNHNVMEVIFNQKKLKSKIKKDIPQINKINLKVKKFNNINIKVTEFGVVGYVQKNHHFKSVLTNGVIDPHPREKIYQERPIFDNFSDEKGIKQIAKIYQKIPDSVRNNISEIKLTHSKINPNQIKINMDDGNLVIGDLNTIQKKIVDYSFLTNGKSGKLIVDLEVGTFIRQRK